MKFCPGHSDGSPMLAPRQSVLDKNILRLWLCRLCPLRCHGHGFNDVTCHGIVGLHIRTRVKAKPTIHCRLFLYTHVLYIWMIGQNPAIYYLVFMGSMAFGGFIIWDGKNHKIKNHDPGSLSNHQVHYWGDQGLLQSFGVKFRSFALSGL